ncbi:MAG: 1,4-alpha-glucan branching protein GlgB, partial [Bacteroidota bacterium]
MNQAKPHSLLTDFDIGLFQSGKHFRLYEKMGAHPIEVDGIKGTYFAVYAPAAKSVSVIGNFNYWSGDEHQLFVRWDASGIWEGFIPGLGHGELYKYKIHSNHNDQILEKIDPFGRFFEQAPKTASIVWKQDYNWNDAEWMDKRAQVNALDQPYSVYEVHLGSWKRKKNGHALEYNELAEELVSYVKEMNYTHVELLPVMEHPFEPSWGYQVTGYYAPCSRHGVPETFKFLVDKFHQAGIGVILDWVPSHFPSDAHGLANFDGTCVYEHPDRRKGYHPDWKSLIFNYGRNEVRSFLISNAIFWLDQYHVDGLRVDAVASMLYLDYSREEGEWEPNQYGGNENLDAISFIKDFNKAVYEAFPDVQTIAEESTAFGGVSKPVHLGGLGFGMKWMMGWMNDTLAYFQKEPIHRKYQHDMITFSMAYAFSENFMLPLSHDEVVHGKNSIIYKMPGDDWQRFANVRLLYT